MIRPLRARHRLIVTLLAIVLPVLVALGLVARREIPTHAGPAPAITDAGP